MEFNVILVFAIIFIVYCVVKALAENEGEGKYTFNILSLVIKIGVIAFFLWGISGMFGI